MPRRKQDRPKRMKWEDSGEELKDDETGDDNLPSSSQASECDPSEGPPQVTADDEAGANDTLCRKTPSPRSISRGSAMSDARGEEIRLESRTSPVSAAHNASPLSLAAHRTSPLSTRASPMLSVRTSPVVMVPHTDGIGLKPSVIINHILDGSRTPSTPPQSSGTPGPSDQDRPLDFSVKSRSSEERAIGNVLNLSKASSERDHTPSTSDDRPLDLSVPRKRAAESQSSDSRKSLKMDGALATPLSPWGAHFPFRFTPSSSPTSSVEVPMWNGKVKGGDRPLMSPTSNATMAHQTPSGKLSASPEPTATKALEKMTELTRMGGSSGAADAEVYQRMLGGRQSAWQSHWLSKGAEQARDVLKCVWCKQSFKSLAEMTAHMKEARHCGVNVSGTSSTSSTSSSSSAAAVAAAVPKNATVSSGSTASEELNMLIKETMPLPRKLVRGQDVWLGKGAEQTKQILKCMWCGQSFKSLADMTTHMQQTQHYTNIISQEQIISWKSPEDKSSTQSHVNAVLTCKVCDQAFSSLKDLSNHMVKNSHYKEHILRSITESGGRRRQTREKRKKSLPVRKLLELERAQHEIGKGPVDMKLKEAADATGRIMCEKCGEKIDTAAFVDHVRQCVGGSSRNLLKSALLSAQGPGDDPTSGKDERRSVGDESDNSRANSVDSNPRSSGAASVRSEVISSRNARHPRDSPDSDSEAPSVLNAIERLIEKSFDTRGRKSVVTSLSPSASILKRLGVEDSANYTKPLMDGGRSSSIPLMLSPRPSSKEGIPLPSVMASPRPSPKSLDTIMDRPHSSPASERGGAMSVDRKSVTPDPPPMSPAAKSDKSCVLHGCGTPPASLREEPLSPARSTGHSDPPDIMPEQPCLLPACSPKDVRSSPDLGDKSNSCTRSSKSVTRTPEPPELERKSPGCASDSGKLCIDNTCGDRSSLCTDEPEDRRTPREEVGRSSPDSLISPSPCNSDRSFTPKGGSSDKERECPEDLSVKSRDSDKATTPSPSPNSNFFSSTGSLVASSPSSDHPLRELQKLLDKTDAHMAKPSTSQASTTTSSSHQGSPGAILAFSWACNDAVMTDSIMKCAFCDTPFISKGAYRHHLSKMHFVKDGAIPETSNSKTPVAKVANNNNNTTNNNSSKAALKTNFDESPTSKFLKYTELAKQLSSKYV